MNVAGLLLAAGAGTRSGRPKAEIELNGERLVDIGVRTLADGGCFPVVVVAGAAELTVPDVTLVSNPGWATGMGSSLRAGLAALEDLDVNAVVVLLVDTPWVSSEAVRRVAGNASAAAVATYGGHRGHPCDCPAPYGMRSPAWPKAILAPRPGCARTPNEFRGGLHRFWGLP